MRSSSAGFRGQIKLVAISTITMTIWFSISGCVPALPGEDRPVEIARYSIAADFSAADAKQLAEQVRVEREQSERLVKEARELAERSLSAEQRCRELVAKIPKKPKIIYLRPKPVEKKKSDDGEAEKEEPKKPVVPLYSPSDAPADAVKKVPQPAATNAAAAPVAKQAGNDTPNPAQ